MDDLLKYILKGTLQRIKRYGGLFLVVFLIVTIPKWIGAAKKEVEYNKDLKNYTPVFADIVRIKPIEEDFSVSSESINLYCKGELVSGEKIWVCLTVEQYIEYINSNYSDPMRSAEKLFEPPLRLHGRVETVGRTIDEFHDNNNFVLIVKSIENSPGG